MSKILLAIENQIFFEDLKQQFSTQEDWEVTTDDDADIVFDAAVVDEDIIKARDLHQKLLHTPLFLLLSAGKEYPDCDGLNIIDKPFRLEELFDEIQSAINAAPIGDILDLKDYILHWNTKEITCLTDSQKIKLTEREIAILKYLYKTKGKTVSKSELLAEVWGYNPEATTHTVETHIYRLRQKIEQDNRRQLILTEENGYRLIWD